MGRQDYWREQWGIPTLAERRAQLLANSESAATVLDSAARSHLKRELPLDGGDYDEDRGPVIAHQDYAGGGGKQSKLMKRGLKRKRDLSAQLEDGEYILFLCIGAAYTVWIIT